MSTTNTTTRSGTILITALPQTVAVPFCFQLSTDLAVLDAGSTGTPHDPALVLALNSDYTVTGGGYDGNTNMQTGSIVVVSGGTNSVQVGDYITITRATPATQATKYAATGIVTFQMVEQALDKLTNLAQEGISSHSLALQFEPQESLSGVLSLASRKNAFLTFDANGNVNLLQNTTLGSGVYTNPNITGKTGGGTANIDGIPTAGITIPTIAIFVISGSSSIWQLKTSSATTGPGVIQPLSNSALRWIQAG